MTNNNIITWPADPHFHTYSTVHRYGTSICSHSLSHYLTTQLLFLTLSLGEDGEQIAAVLPGRDEVSVAVLSSGEDSGETGHSSLSEADSLDDSRASRAEERSPTWRMAWKGLP